VAPGGGFQDFPLIGKGCEAQGTKKKVGAKGLAYAPELKTNLAARCPQCPSHNIVSLLAVFAVVDLR
jgi:hypothetical protein